MEKEQINKLFNEFFFRMAMTDKSMEKFEVQLRIAFQEGIIKAQDYYLKEFNKRLK